MAWFRRERAPAFDRDRLQPAVRRSYCNREMTLGFIEKENGRFHEYCCANTQAELEAFCAKYGVTAQDLKTIY